MDKIENNVIGQSPESLKMVGRREDAQVQELKSQIVFGIQRLGRRNKSFYVLHSNVVLLKLTVMAPLWLNMPFYQAIPFHAKTSIWTKTPVACCTKVSLDEQPSPRPSAVVLVVGPRGGLRCYQNTMCPASQRRSNI